MPKFVVTSRLVGCTLSQVIEAEDPDEAAREFTEGDWSPVVAMVAAAPDTLLPGVTTLTVTMPN